MMIHLTCSNEKLIEQFGLDPQRNMLFPAIRLDSRAFVTPLIARSIDATGKTVEGTEEYLLARQQERGNLQSAGVDLDKVRFYDPWVNLDERIVAGLPVAESLVSLVEEIAEGDDICLSAEVPFAHFESLSQRLNVSIEESRTESVVAYEIDKARVLENFKTWREAGVEEAKRLINGVEHLVGLSDELGADVDTRFDLLNRLAAQDDLDAVLMGAPINFGEVVGFSPEESAFALWVCESQRLFVLAPDVIRNITCLPVSRYESLAHAVQDLATGGVVGVEEEWLPSGTASKLVATGVKPRHFSKKLGHWRDVRDHEDLAFQIMASRVSVYAIEEALEWANSELEAGQVINELDVNRVYLEKLTEFRVSNGITFGIEPYFTNLHSSNRMLFPGPPVDYPLDRETTCVQLDAGVAITINGIVLATSDMARSLPRVPEAVEAYDFFFKVVREGIIGQIKPGMSCEAIHEAAMEYVEPHLDRMIEIGMLGPEVDFRETYRKRNVGHLMGKMESFTNELRPGYEYKLEVGSYGAAEIPWRYHRSAIGTEELWYIGQFRTYILSQK